MQSPCLALQPFKGVIVMFKIIYEGLAYLLAILAGTALLLAYFDVLVQGV